MAKRGKVVLRESSFVDKLKDTGGPLLLIALTIFFSNPLLIYFGNMFDFRLSYKYTLLIMVLTVLTFVAVGVMILIPVRRFSGAFRKTISIVAAIGVLLWIESNILNINFGTLDGRRIEWARHYRFAIADAALWLFILATALIKSDYIFRQVKKNQYWSYPASASCCYDDLVAGTGRALMEICPGE